MIEGSESRCPKEGRDEPGRVSVENLGTGTRIKSVTCRPKGAKASQRAVWWEKNKDKNFGD